MKKSLLNLSMIFVSATLCISLFILMFGEYGFEGLFDGFDKSSDFVEFLDVGEADCIIIYSNGNTALIDTGSLDTAKNICSKLSDYDVKEINAMLITHLHNDHAGGAEYIANNFKVNNLIVPMSDEESEADKTVNNTKIMVANSGGKVFTATEGLNYNIGDFEITVIGYSAKAKEENNRSIITMAKLEDKKFLFLGDAEKSGQTELLENKMNISCDVIKIGHHGSSNANNEDLLDSANPLYAVISCGKRNFYNHPSSRVLNAIKERNISVFTTADNGNIKIFAEKGGLRVETEYQN